MGFGDCGVGVSGSGGFSGCVGLRLWGGGQGGSGCGGLKGLWGGGVRVCGVWGGQDMWGLEALGWGSGHAGMGGIGGGLRGSGVGVQDVWALEALGWGCQGLGGLGMCGAGALGWGSEFVSLGVCQGAWGLKGCGAGGHVGVGACSWAIWGGLWGGTSGSAGLEGVGCEGPGCGGAGYVGLEAGGGSRPPGGRGTVPPWGGWSPLASPFPSQRRTLHPLFPRPATKNRRRFEPTGSPGTSHAGDRTVFCPVVPRTRRKHACAPLPAPKHGGREQTGARWAPSVVWGCDRRLEGVQFGCAGGVTPPLCEPETGSKSIPGDDPG